MAAYALGNYADLCPALVQVLPLEEAADKAHISKFDEEREVQAVKRRNLTGIKDGLFWHECVGTYPATGQKFR